MVLKAGVIFTKFNDWLKAKQTAVALVVVGQRDDAFLLTLESIGKWHDARCR
jgi:hypothetical protein